MQSTFRPRRRGLTNGFSGSPEQGESNRFYTEILIDPVYRGAKTACPNGDIRYIRSTKRYNHSFIETWNPQIILYSGAPSIEGHGHHCSEMTFLHWCPSWLPTRSFHEVEIVACSWNSTIMNHAKSKASDLINARRVYRWAPTVFHYWENVISST